MQFQKLCTFVLIFAFAACFAQAQTGTVSGTVTDSSGAVVPGARITAANVATNAVRTVETGESGSFAMVDLLAGKYNFSIEKDGFNIQRYAALPVTVAQTLSLNVTLETGGVSQTVEVSGDSVPPVDLESSQLSTVVDQRRILDLPLLTRNPYDLILLSPGTVQTNSGLGGFSVNGSRERNNNFLLDGVDNNDAEVPGIPGGVASLNPDSTQEFRVITNNFLPEYGRNTGAIIDIVTRGGSGQFHGSAYWFGRYNALAARDFFNEKDTPQDPFVRNDFGFSASGPIVKDKTFFFVNDEYQRFNTTVVGTSIVPTAAFKTGVFNFDGHAINLADPNSPTNAQHLPLDPEVQKILALLPNPNGEAVDDVRGIYRYPNGDALTDSSVAFRLDHRISEKHSFFARYSYSGTTDPNQSFLNILPGIGGVATAQQSHSIAANLASVFRPNLVNEFRAGVNRGDLSFGCTGLNTLNSVGPKDEFGRGSDYGFSGILGVGCGALNDSDGQAHRQGTWHVADNLSWIKGSHNLKFGGDFRYVFANGYNTFSSRQFFTFDGFTSFNAPFVNLDPNHPCDPASGNNCGGNQFQNLASGLLGVVDSQSQFQFFDKNGTRQAFDYRNFRQHEYSVYAQDIWKVNPFFTLNYGLRYQFSGVPTELNGNLSNLFANPQGAAPFTFSLVGAGTHHLLYNNDPTNFEPRLGFNWDPLHKGKTSIRGGAGIFHDRIFGNLSSNATVNPPFLGSLFTVPGAPLSTLPPAPTVPTSATVPDGSFLTGVNVIDSNLKNPYSINWNFGVQQQLPQSLTLEVNYVGSKGVHALRVVNGNQALPSLVAAQLAAGVPPAFLQFQSLYVNYPTTANTAFFEPALTQSTGNSTFHSLQTVLNRRFSHGFQFQGAYTWAHAIDDAADPLVPAANNRSFPRNSFNLREERGNASFDVRQRLAMNYIYEFPFGRGKTYLKDGVIGRVLEDWQLSGITSWQTGLPYDVFGNVDTEHTGFSSRADLVGNPAIPAGSPRTQTGPPVTTFAFAPFGRPGNLGRNSFYGPGFFNTDATLLKNTSITERLKAQLRFEFFNIFNTPQLGQPGNTIQDPATFGISTATVLREDGTTSNRQIQLAMKLTF